jgi:hypothetical protein
VIIYDVVASNCALIKLVIIYDLVKVGQNQIVP